MANFFERLRLFGINPEATTEQAFDTNTFNQAEIETIEHNYALAKAVAEADLSKGFNEKEVAYQQQLYADMTITTPGYKNKPSYNNFQDLHSILKAYGKNIILNAIINTRASQVARYCQPTRYTNDGMGFAVTLKDKNVAPTEAELKEMKRIEEFIMNTGDTVDITRDTFLNFCKKIVRDTYRFDQVNFEKVFDKNQKLRYLKMVDPTTIFLKLDKDGKLSKTKYRYVQVLNERAVAQFQARELAFGIRNPRSDIEIGGYGMSELEIALTQFVAQENTEKFNDRFFSHGGTTRGMLLIKAGQQQSAHALDIFRREWNNSLSGINGSWKIPVITADDAKFINMTPSANDMQFEKWLNYLINVISSLYGIDPSEINFPNNGGATGSHGGALNEGNSKEKNQASQNKGLLPLLQFIESMINDNVVSEFSNKYVFSFVGGDTISELDKIKVIAEKTKTAMTINEARAELGLKGDILGGDVPANGAIIQRIGQLLQQEQFEYQKQQTKLERMLSYTEPQQDDGNLSESSGEGIKDPEQSMAQNKAKVEGKGNSSVGKDGQSKDLKNTNSHGQNGKGKDKDWAKD